RIDISPNITVLGCTFWSRLNPVDPDIVPCSLTDFHAIVKFDLSAYQALHERDFAWLEDALTHIHGEEPGRHLIVLTHHVPTIEGTSDPKYNG
ncbi:hypothetical protein DFH11DRAFT_1481974, partial [Phellopilus nigrolimitatus]